MSFLSRYHEASKGSEELIVAVIYKVLKCPKVKILAWKITRQNDDTKLRGTVSNFGVFFKYM